MEKVKGKKKSKILEMIDFLYLVYRITMHVQKSQIEGNVPAGLVDSLHLSNDTLSV